LRGIPSVFERLIFIISLANRPDNCETGGGELVRAEHTAIFETWLSLSLEQKLEDLSTCAHWKQWTPHDLARQYLQPPCYKKLIPAGALLPERELFEMELETLLPLLARSGSSLR